MIFVRMPRKFGTFAWLAHSLILHVIGIWPINSYKVLEKMSNYIKDIPLQKVK